MNVSININIECHSFWFSICYCWILSIDILCLSNLLIYNNFQKRSYFPYWLSVSDLSRVSKTDLKHINFQTFQIFQINDRFLGTKLQSPLTVYSHFVPINLPWSTQLKERKREHFHNTKIENLTIIKFNIQSELLFIFSGGFTLIAFIWWTYDIVVFNNVAKDQGLNYFTNLGSFGFAYVCVILSGVAGLANVILGFLVFREPSVPAS